MVEITSILKEILPSRKQEKGLTQEEWTSLLEKKNKEVLGKNIPPRFANLYSGTDEGLYFTIIKDPLSDITAIFCNTFYPRKNEPGVKDKSPEDKLNNAVLVTPSGPVFYQENIQENNRVWQQIPDSSSKGKLTAFYDYFANSKLFDPNKGKNWWGNVPDMEIFKQFKQASAA